MAAQVAQNGSQNDDLDLCRVQSEPLSHDEAVASVTSGDCGAVATKPA